MPLSPAQRIPYWHITMPALPRFDGRALPERADVVIVGGGYTGLAAALSLARRGAAVTLLERVELGAGASTRNGGIVHPGLKLGRAALVRRYGEERGSTVYRAGLEAFSVTERFIEQEGFDCDYRRTGLVVLAWSPKDMAGLERQLAEMQAAGFAGRVLRGSDVRDESGTDHYAGGIVIEASGMLHPGRYFAALAAAAQAAGVDLHTGTAALRVDIRGPGDRVVVTERGSVRAGAVLVATNGYTDSAVPWLHRRILPIGSYIVATEPMDDDLAWSVSPRGRVFYDTKSFLYYWHVNGERRLIFGGRASFRRTTVEGTTAILRGALAAVYPQAAHLRIEHAWGGKVGFTFDRLPHLGEHGGVNFAMGYCGTGVTGATAFGLYMAERLGRASDVASVPCAGSMAAFEALGFPGAPLVPGAYRGDPWFLPVVGEVYRARDRWRRRGFRPVAAARGASSRGAGGAGGAGADAA